MTFTKQIRHMPSIDKERKTEKLENLDSKAIFFDSLDKLCANLDDLENNMQNYRDGNSILMDALETLTVFYERLKDKNV